MERFDRVMFWLLVPGVLLVAAVAIVLPLVPSSPSTSGLWLVHLVFLYVLLGSVTLNAWLALRHPSSWTQRSVPRRIGQVQASLYVAVLLFGAISVAGMRASSEEYQWGPVIAVAVALMTLSVWSWMLVDKRGSAYQREVPLIELRLPGRARLAIAGYLVAAIVVTLLALVVRAPETVAYWVFPLILLGLPWSHPVFLWVSLPVANTGYDTFALLVTLAVPIVANIALAAAVLFSSRVRVRLANWFFRLGRRRVQR